MTDKSTNTDARGHALKFLYQCEIDKLYYFSDSHFNSFFSYFEIKEPVKKFAKHLVEGTFSKLNEIDQILGETSKKWTLDRMSIVDRSLLRLCTFELMDQKTPKKVVINEGVELAKTFGSENSGGFVNGILDTIAKKMG